MSKIIQIKLNEIEITAELNESNTARIIWEALPIKGQVNLWGEEIYFSIPLSLELEEGKELVDNGDLGYWPQGKAFCIFFGPTPISEGNEIRPASPVTVFGEATGDISILKQITAGTEIIIEQQLVR
jgi:hypothetical protein